MYALYLTFSITTAVFCLLLISYFPIVWLNITFTFSNLSLQDVPFYAECSSNIVDSTLCTLVDFVYSTNRFHFYWFIMATDVLLIVAVFLPWTTMMYLVISGEWCNIFLIHTLPCAIIAGLQLLKVIVLIFGWLICKSVNFCRNFDSALGANPNNANWIYIATVIYSVAFTIISTIYALVYTVFENGIKQYQKEIGLIVIPDAQISIVPTPEQPQYGTQYSTLTSPAPTQQPQYGTLYSTLPTPDYRGAESTTIHSKRRANAPYAMRGSHKKQV